MYISNIMNKQSQNEWFCLLGIWNHASYIFIDEVISVVAVSCNPVINMIDSLVNAVGIINELRIVLEIPTLVQVRCVNKVPSILPLPIDALLLELISKSWTLNKRIIEFWSYHLRSCRGVNFQHLICLVKRISSFSSRLEHIISSSCYENMPEFPESMGASEK